MGGPLQRPVAIGKALRMSNPRILLESNKSRVFAGLYALFLQSPL